MFSPSLFYHLSDGMTLNPYVADEKLLGPDLFLSSCALDLSLGPCRYGVCSRALIHFSTIIDFVKDDNRTSHISIKPIITHNFLWNGYSPEAIQVNCH